MVSQMYVESDDAAPLRMPIPATLRTPQNGAVTCVDGATHRCCLYFSSRWRCATAHRIAGATECCQCTGCPDDAYCVGPGDDCDAVCASHACLGFDVFTGTSCTGPGLCSDYTPTPTVTPPNTPTETPAVTPT
jgi:hypothetical protein